MLGEDHSLLVEFPEYKEAISELVGSDEVFAKDAKRYDELDAEIRSLEERGTPIDDDAMHELKNERASLKDSLYSRLGGASVS
ncbi:YdcH family protein [Pelagicoccus mobilis]|uniref:YdcH family protein n=1 Tax=Pelagicoccus mobilis TaxID=415221 RepID=A0A934S669_9BACT|nr:YdcH family protein [Pelagicoccus mobilis]MBK1880119.1 YdcH family protein [Pelagicoccus mobilis]